MRDATDFRALEHDWKELQSICPRIPASARWEWVWQWWLTFGARCPATGEKGFLYVFVASVDGRCIGIVPMVGHRSGNPFSLRRLRSIGYAGEFEPRGMTEEPTSVIFPGREQEVWTAVGRSLEGVMDRDRWDCAVIVRGCTEASPAGPFRWTRSKAGPNIVQLPSTWEAFRGNLSRSMRDNLSYYERLIVRHGRLLEFKISTERHDIEAAVAELAELHVKRARTSRRIRENYFESDAQIEFFRKSILRATADANAFVATLSIDGKPAACQAFFKSGHELTASYSGFDPEAAAYSPLLILQGKVFRSAIESGTRTLDLLPGTAQWQARWRPEQPYPMVRSYRLRPSPAALVRALLYAIRRDVRARYRRSGLPSRISAWIERRQATFGLLTAGPWRAAFHHIATSPHWQHAHHVVRLRVH